MAKPFTAIAIDKARRILVRVGENIEEHWIRDPTSVHDSPSYQKAETLTTELSQLDVRKKSFLQEVSCRVDVRGDGDS